jgi:ADP-heptose:LPS heptosyltransferase
VVLDSILRPLYDKSVAWRRYLLARTTAGLPVSHFRAEDVRRVLMVCTGLIGDTVMSLPALAAARKLFPGAQTAVIATPVTAALVEMGAPPTRLLVTDASPLSLRAEQRLKVRELQRVVTNGKFDLAVILLGDDFAPMLTRSGIPHRVFVAESPYARLATATYGIGHPRTWGPQERLNAWRALALSPPDERPSLHVPRATADAGAKLLGNRPGRSCLVVHPFGRTPDQRWPLSLATRFMTLVERELGLASVVVGNPPSNAPVPGDDPRFRLAGRLTIEELAGVLYSARAVVSTDSGPFHLAGALGRPGVGLFRASRPEHARRYPSLAAVLAPSDPGCLKRCSWDRCRWTPCRQMSAVEPEVVVAAVRRQLAEFPA